MLGKLEELTLQVSHLIPSEELFQGFNSFSSTLM